MAHIQPIYIKNSGEEKKPTRNTFNDEDEVEDEKETGRTKQGIYKSDQEQKRKFPPNNKISKFSDSKNQATNTHNTIVVCGILFVVMLLYTEKKLSLLLLVLALLLLLLSCCQTLYAACAYYFWHKQIQRQKENTYRHRVHDEYTLCIKAV